MDLALHLGGTAEALTRSMTEHEFEQWMFYANRRMLPFRRIELYLARIAMLIAQTMGGASDVTLADFLFDPEPEHEDMDEADVETAKAFFGFTPRVKD